MIRKKLMNLIIVLLISVSSLFLAACGPRNNPGGGNNGGGNNGGGNNGGGIDVPDIPDTPGNDKTVDEMFSKFKIVTKDNSVKVVDPTSDDALVDFDTLVERQIDVLANDILYRLVAVYGGGTTNLTTEIAQYNAPAFALKKLSGDPYAYGNNAALISNFDLISKPIGLHLALPQYRYSDWSILDIYQQLSLNEPATYSYLISNGAYLQGNSLTIYFNNSNSINGGLYWDSDNGFHKPLGFNENLEWNWSYTDLTINPNSFSDQIYNAYQEYYIDPLKTAIANILAGTTDLEFGNAVSKIEYLGFTKTDREKIFDFVFKTIIGEELIELDNYIFDNVLNELTDYKFTNITADLETLETASENAEFDQFTFNQEGESTYWLKKHMWHYYKAYNILVPEMLDRAFSNSFGGLEIDRVKYIPGSEPKQPILVDGKLDKYDLDDYESFETIDGINYISLYPKMTRSSQFDIPVEPNADEVKMTDELYNIKSLILQPKTDVSLLELWMAISTETNIRVKFQVRVKYVANGAVYLDEYVKSTSNNNSTIFDITGMYDTDPSLAGQGTPWYFDLNVSDHMNKNSAGHYIALDGTTTSPNYPVMNVYNGKDLSVNEYDLWNDNPFKLSGYEAGDNYVELSFNIIEAWELDGSTSTEYLGDVLFSIGFSDPWF